MGGIRQTEKWVDRIVAIAMELRSDGSERPAQLHYIQLIVKLAIAAAILNIPGFVLMNWLGSAWPFVVWFLGNMFLWAGPAIYRWLYGPGDPHQK